MMGGARIGVALVACLAVAGVAEARRRLTVTASRAETLNAASQDADCAELFKTANDQLPLHVVRLQASAGSTPVESVRFEWSLPDPNLGKLIADDDIPADEQASVIRALCAELGNTCELTEEQLKVYSKPTILWVAPICSEALPTNASKPYRGGKVKIGVRATAGKRKLGKGSVTVGYGRTASVLLTMRGRSGDGRPEGLPASLKETFVARIDQTRVPLPPVSRYEFTNGDGDSASVETTAPEADATMTYSSPGKHTATVSAELRDGSALCDNLLANVQSAINRLQVTVETAPKRESYRPGDPASGIVTLRVRVRNVSDPATGSAILIEGGSVLSCDTAIRVGKSQLSSHTQIDFQHCSKTVEQPCESNADCGSDACPNCESGESCLASSHCANTFSSTGDTLACVRDSDCPLGDNCVMVLPLSSLVLPIGESSDLVSSTIPVANTLPNAAKVTETWTAHARNAPDDSATVRYTIESNPAVKP